MEELRADVDELRALQREAKQKRTRDVLAIALAAATQELAALSAPPPSAPAAAAAPASEAAAAPAPAAAEAAAVTPRPSKPPAWTEVNSFGWDAGEYNTPWVSVYVTLDGVTKDQVSCDFSKDGFDLRVQGLGGKNYRLRKDNLEHEIVASESKVVVRRDRITIKLKKVKGEFSFDSWTSLTAKKAKAAKQSQGSDPMGGIMDLMKDMYKDGDDNMKKIIAESMMKAQAGGGGDKPDLGDLGGGLGGF